MRRFIALLAFLALAPFALAENWPQWRGPTNDGHSTETKLPSEWGEDKNVVWKIVLPGPGAGTPCIWGEKIFLTAVADKNLVLACYSTAGDELWKKTIGQGNKAARGDEGNSASASCSTDGKRVYAFVGDGHLVAFDFDGKEVWTVDTAKEYGAFKIQFGAHWTPALHDGKLYVALLHQTAQVVVAFDAESGKELWKVDRKSDGKGESPDVYASPFVWSKGKDAQLVVHGNDYCTGHSLKDGTELWRVTELNPKSKYNNFWRAVASPLITPDLLVIPSCKNGVTVAIDPSKAKGEIGPGASDAGEVWRIAKDTPDVPTPVIVDGHLFVWKENESLLAYNAKTGKPTGSLKVTNERHRASPVYADGKLILVGREGTMATVKPTAEPELISKMKLKDTFTASPAISGGRIYLRGWKSLYAIGEK